MNGQNGTEFDWYVNDRLSSFMVFYNDEANLGAVKLYLNRSATADVFLYGEQGKKFLKQDTCPDCAGTRLSENARAPKLLGISLDEACRMTLSEISEWVGRVRPPFRRR